MAESSRRRVTFVQLETLWEFLNEHKEIATGYNKTAQAREYSRRMWLEVAEQLNSLGDGATKDWKGWCKYWNDYKCKLKKMAAAAKVSHSQTGGGPSSVKPLTNLENKFLQILGPNFGEGLPGMQVEPFEEELTPGSESILAQYVVFPSFATSTAPNSSHQEPGPSWRLTEPPPLIDPQPAVTAIPTASPPAPEPAIIEPILDRALTPPPERTAPQRTPRRRRQRREPPMSQEAARRALIRISEERVEIERHNSNLLGALLNELREIKEILRSRSIGSPTNEE